MIDNNEDNDVGVGDAISIVDIGDDLRVSDFFAVIYRGDGSLA